MSHRIICTLVIIAVLLVSCNYDNQPSGQRKTDQYQKLHQLGWLPGSWANLSDDGNFYEEWTRVNDSVYTAYSHMTISGDTVFSESVTLAMKGNDLFYIVSVSDQNEGHFVSFRLVSSDNNEFVFENKEHDFPQRIIYKHPKPDSIHARIEGTVNGKFSMQEFPMKRQNK